MEEAGNTLEKVGKSRKSRFSLQTAGKAWSKSDKCRGDPKETLWDPVRGWDTSGHSNAGGVNLEVAHASALWRIAEKKCGAEGAAFLYKKLLNTHACKSLMFQTGITLSAACLHHQINT